jgi:hypothetical protein
MIAFYGLEQFLPIQLLFYFQFCKNKSTSINAEDDDSQKLTDSLVENAQLTAGSENAKTKNMKQA